MNCSANSELFKVFIDEANEQLNNMEKCLLKLEKDSKDLSLVNEIFRNAHTIKGSSLAMEYNHISSLTHKMEDVLQLVREGKLIINDEVLEILFVCYNSLNNAIQEVMKNSEPNLGTNNLMERLRETLQKRISNKNNETNSSLLEGNCDEELRVQIVNEISEHNKNTKIDVLSMEHCSINIIKSIFKEFHTIRCLSAFINKNQIQEVSYSSELLVDSFLKFPDKNRKKYILDALLKTCEIIEELIGLSDDKIDLELKQKVKLHLSLLNNCKECLLKEATNNNLSTNTKEEGQEVVKLRIPIQKVDSLSEKLLEMMIQESMLKEKVEQQFGSNNMLLNNINRMIRLAKEMQEASVSWKRVPLYEVSESITKFMFDLAYKLNQKIDIIITGSELEVDKYVSIKLFETLKDFLQTQLLWRIKRENSKVHVFNMKIYKKQGNIYIEITDEGKDITYINSTFKIKEVNEEGLKYEEELKRISRNLNNEEDRLEYISNEDSTNYFKIRMSMNIMVLDGMVIKLLNDLYIVPTLYIKEIYISRDKDFIIVNGKEKMLKVRNDIFPIIQLDKIFGNEVTINYKSYKLFLILQVDNNVVALPVDNIIERQDFAVKPLEKEIYIPSIITKASIIGNGKVILFLDIEKLIEN